jgi:N-methylhydantoinase B
VVRLETPGGGGFGDPLDRDPQAVLLDVREGYVSPQAADIAYGVVLRQERHGWILDAAATQTLRAALRTRRMNQEDA